MCRQLSVCVPVLSACCLLVSALPVGRAADLSEKPVDGKAYVITNVHSGKRLAIAGGSKEVHGLLVQDSSKKNRVTWRLEKLSKGHFRIVNTSSDMALDVGDASKEVGVQIQQFPAKPEGTANQEWEFIKRGDYYAIRGRDSRLVLTVDNDSTDDGAAVKQFPLKDGEHNSQRWILTEPRKK